MFKVSVIIPVYNVEQYLAKCLDSVINQTYKNLEIICVNDCSPDHSPEILKQYAQKDGRIIIVNREQNGGLSAARNSGMDIAQGKYLYFLDSDDWIDLNYIEKMVNSAEKNKVSIVLNTNILAEYSNETKRFTWIKYPKAPDDGEILLKEHSLGITQCMTWAHLYGKDFIDKYNLRFPEGYIHEDNYFHYVTEIWAEKIYAFDGPAYHYLQRDNGIMSSRQDKLAPRLLIMNLILDYFEKHEIKKEGIVNVQDFISLTKIETEATYNLLKSSIQRVNDLIQYDKGYNEFFKYRIKVVQNTNSLEEYNELNLQQLMVNFLRDKARIKK